MREISQILCVIDPTADSQPALGRAVFIARVTSAELELFICYYVHPETDSGFDFATMAELQKSAIQRCGLSSPY